VSQSNEFCRHNPLCCFSTGDYRCKLILRYRLSPEIFGYTHVVLTSATDTGIVETVLGESCGQTAAHNAVRRRMSDISEDHRVIDLKQI
jgi:hypothetical protein